MIRTDEALESGSFYVSFSVKPGEPFSVVPLNETFPVWLTTRSVRNKPRPFRVSSRYSLSEFQACTLGLALSAFPSCPKWLFGSRTLPESQNFATRTDRSNAPGRSTAIDVMMSGLELRGFRFG